MFGNQPDETEIPDSSKNGGEAKLFGSEQKRTVDVTTDFGANLSNIDRRLRMLEERHASLQKRTQLTEENMLNLNKKINLEIKTINSEINEIRNEIAEIKEKMELVVNELRACAKKEDITVLERYMNMWDPASFITQKDVENVVRRVISKNSESFKKE